MAEYIKRADALEAICKRCNCCTEPCPMADMAHEAAKGRMYATNEFILLQKKVESGQLVEVVRCKNCIHYDLGVCLKIYSDGNAQKDSWQSRNPDDFCSSGERNGGDSDES